MSRPRNAEVDAWLAAEARPCTACRETKPFSEFYPKNRPGRDRLPVHAQCKPCLVASRVNHVRQITDTRLRWLDDRRGQAIEALGGACTACGILDRRVLQIDHIVPLAGKRRPSRVAVFRAAIEGDSNLQLLCANCHSIKTWHS